MSNEKSKEKGLELAKLVKQGSSLGALLFVTLAEQGDTFDPTTLAENSEVFEPWVPDFERGYKAGQIRRGINGVMYKCNTTHGKEHTGVEPGESDLWDRLADPAEEYPEWFPASGTFDQWPPGAKCTYNGNHYVNTLGINNVWLPTEYGWDGVVT